MISYFLRYGDLLTFKFRGKIEREKGDGTDPEFENCQGFLGGMGQLDGRVYMQSVGEGIEELDAVHQNNDIMPHMTNHRDFIFVVTPKLSFEFHKDYYKTFKQYQKFMKQLNIKKTITKEKEEIRKNYENKLEKLKERVLKEKELNKQTIKNNEGKNFLNYGNDIQLMHKDSGNFLAAMNVCSQTKKIGYSCELTDWHSERMVFKLFPKFKSREIGDLVQAKESVIIYNSYNGCYINFSKKESTLYNDVIHTNDNSEFRFRRHKTMIDPTSKRHEVFLSQANTCSWSIELHSRLRSESNNDMIYGDNIIRLQHTESKGNIGASTPMTMDHAEIYAKNYHGEFYHEKNKLDGLWEIEHLKMDKRGKDFKCKLLKNDLNENYRMSDEFRLRNFITGRYFTKSHVHRHLLAVLSNENEVSNPASYSVLRFEPLMKSIDMLKVGHSYYLKSEDFYIRHNIKHSLSNDLIIQQFENDNHTIEMSHHNDDGELQVNFLPLTEEAKEEKKTALYFEKQYSTEDAYLVKGIDNDFLSEIFFVRSGVLRLNEIIAKLRTGQIPGNEDYSIVYVMLVKIIYFLYDEPFFIENEATEFNHDPIQRRQFIFREFGFLEILTDLVFTGFQSKLYTYESIEENEFFKIVLRQSYSAIKHIIQEYRPNELYASQWLQPIMKQSLETIDKTEIKASTTLVELLDNNKKILENRVDKRVIEFFIKSIKDKEKDARYLKILYVLCICNGKQIPKNQLALTKLIFGDKAVMQKMNLEIRKNKSLDVVDSSTNKVVPIKNLLQQVSESEEENEAMTKFAEYFVGLIKLYSAICFNRNLGAIKILQQVFDYVMCCQILADEEIHHKIRASFALFLRDLWININPFYPIETPNHIIIWSDAEFKKSLNVEFSGTSVNAQKSQKFNDLKKFILNYLSKINVKEMMKVEGKASFVLNLLQIILCFVNLGFFNTEEVPELIGRLKILLFEKLKNASYEKMEDNDELRDLSETKKVIVQIFMRLLSFQLDMRTRLFCFEFKKLYDQNRDSISEESVMGDEEQIKLNVKTNKVVPYWKNNARNSNDDEDSMKQQKEFDEKVFQIVEKKMESKDWIHLDDQDNFKSLLLMITAVNDYSLKTEMLNLMNQMHSQTSLLKESLVNLQLITEESRPDYEIVKEMSLKLQEYSLNVSEFYKQEHSEAVLETINTIIHMIMPPQIEIELVDAEATIPVDQEDNSDSHDESNMTDSDEDEQSIGMNVLFESIIKNKTCKPNNFMQDLMRNMNLYKHLAAILVYDLEIFKRAKNRNIKLIQKIYWLFAMACRRNPMSKKYFLDILKDIGLMHLLSSTDLNVEIFLFYLVEDNQHLLIDFDQVRIVTEALIVKIQKLSKNDIRKTILMCTLALFGKVKHMILKTNQDIIMTQIFYKHNAKNITEDYGKPLFLKKIKDESELIQRKFDNSRGRNVVMFSNEMYYDISLLNLLTRCGEGKNLLTENIGQKVLGLEDIEKLIKVEGIPYLYKEALLHFLYDVYLDIEKELPLSLYRTMMGVITFLRDELKSCLDLLTLKKEELFVSQPQMNLKLSNTDVFSCGALHSAEEILQNYIQTMCDCFILIIPNFMKNKSDDLYVEFEQIAIGAASHKASFENIKDEKTRKKLRYLKQMVLSKEKSPHKLSKNGKFIRNISVSNLNLRSGKTFIDSNNIMNRFSNSGYTKSVHKVFKQINRIMDSKNYEKLIEKEFEEWIAIIHVIEKENQEFEKYELFILFLKSLVEYFDTKGEVNETLALTGLKIFRKFIENSTGSNKFDSEFNNDNFSCEEWTNEIWERYRGKIVKRQNLLLETGVVNWICDLFKYNRSPKLNDSAMMLSIALLIGGNEKVQNEFHQKFVVDIDNRILLNLSRHIGESFEVISKNMNQKNERRLKKIINEREVGAAKKGQELFKKKTTAFVVRTEVKDVDLEFILCTRTFRFLQLLCEGHNQTLQNILREQRSLRKGKISVLFREINFLSFTTHIFGRFIKIFNPMCSELGVQILDFLIEVVQGPCLENQKMLFEAKIVDFCKDFLNDLHIQKQAFDDLFKDDKEKQADFVKKVIMLLNAILEGNYNRKIINFMAENLDISFMLSLLTEEYRHYINSNKNSSKETDSTALKRTMQKRVWEEDITEAFNIYFLIKVIDEETGKYTNALKEMGESDRVAYEFFKKNSAHIEIVFKGKIEKYYFVIQPACIYLGENTKKKLMNEVSRDTANEKLTDFVNQVPFLFDTMDHKAHLRSRFIKLNPNLFVFTRFVALMISFAISLIMASMFGKRVENSVGFTRRDFDETKVIFSVLAACHVVLALIMNILWLLIEGPMANMSGWRKKFYEFKRQLNYQIDNNLLEANEDGIEHIQHILLRNVANINKSERIDILAFMNKNAGRKHALNWLEYNIQTILYIVRHPTFRFLNFYLITSILAMYYQREGFLIAYSILLLDVIFWFEVMITVIKSITYNAQQLLLTALLGCIIMYNYSLFAYDYLDDTFFNTGVGENGGENMCVSVIQCFLTVFSLGPRSSGGIGDAIVRQSYQTDNLETFYVRYIFDLTCFILVNLIFMNILFGIIIDTFAELRDKRKVINDDKDNVCFVCSLHRDMFGKQERSFESHVQEDHNIWNYLYFMYYLMKKDKTEFTGLESYVYERVINDNITWIPLLKCRAISEDNHSEELEENLDKMIFKLKDLLAQITSGL